MNEERFSRRLFSFASRVLRSRTGTVLLLLNTAVLVRFALTLWAYDHVHEDDCFTRGQGGGVSDCRFGAPLYVIAYGLATVPSLVATAFVEYLASPILDPLCWVTAERINRTLFVLVSGAQWQVVGYALEQKWKNGLAPRLRADSRGLASGSSAAVASGPSAVSPAAASTAAASTAALSALAGPLSITAVSERVPSPARSAAPAFDSSSVPAVSPVLAMLGLDGCELDARGVVPPRSLRSRVRSRQGASASLVPRSRSLDNPPDYPDTSGGHTRPWQNPNPPSLAAP